MKNLTMTHPGALALTVVVGCSSGTVFFGAGAGGGESTGALGVGGAGGTSTSGNGTSTSSASADASSSSAASSSVASSSSAASSSVAASSSSGGSVSDMLPCGQAGTCEKYCCFGFTQSCQEGPGKCVGLQAKLDCNDTADCASGEVCCATTSGLYESKCSATCTLGMTTFRLCGELSECGAGFTSCSNVPAVLFPGGYKSCNK